MTFRPLELVYRAGIPEFHKSKVSVFNDGYDFEKEKNEVHVISLQSYKSDPDLARVSEYEARVDHLGRRIKQKLNIRGNKRHNFDLNDFNIVVRESESPDMPAFGPWCIWLGMSFIWCLGLRSECMKKLLVGFLTMGAFGIVIYALGYFRHFLEEKFNDGIQYGALNYISSRFQTPINYTVSGTFAAGFMGFAFVLFLCMLAYKIGNYILSPVDEESSDHSEGKRSSK